ncbi:MAG: hypothetical protein RLZ59_633 [Pseudomonadota bacterium]
MPMANNCRAAPACRTMRRDKMRRVELKMALRICGTIFCKANIRDAASRPKKQATALHLRRCRNGCLQFCK